MSADGDAFLFGARTVLQYLTADKKDKGNKSKGRRVQVIRMEDLEKAEPPLTQRVLFSLALFAGGDYNTGLEGCGPKLALEIGASRYGGHLWTMARGNNWGKLPDWRDSLAGELRNDSEFFEKKHTAVANALKKSFPDQNVAKYYMREINEKPATTAIDWEKEPDIPGLWEFTGEWFDWLHRHFAVKFVRIISVALLVRTILRCMSSKTGRPSNLIATVSKTRGEGAKEEAMIKFDRASMVGLNIKAERIVESHKGNLNQVEVKDDPVWLSPLACSGTP
ncbi:DNA repair endonuclease rad2 [Apiospora hydei]|uniref:DNA repair endonuclease rad2 n=1 Tax=Apiospora hydei TaxID=1337664 RepID=A0ABR1V546_9PEZI